MKIALSTFTFIYDFVDGAMHPHYVNRHIASAFLQPFNYKWLSQGSSGTLRGMGLGGSSAVNITMRAEEES